MKSSLEQAARAADYNRIAKAIAYLRENQEQQPDLQMLAWHLQLSPYHTQRLFQRWAGISPKQFTAYLTLQEAKSLLARSKNVLDTALDAGLSGPGRLHDLFVTLDAVTPGEFKVMGRGLTLTYGLHDTPFGRCLIAVTARGICHLSFAEELTPARAKRQLTREWKNATLLHDQKSTGAVIRKIFQVKTAAPLRLFLKGTNFQMKVWEALLKIPLGAVISYEALAGVLKKPSAARAVSRAVASNTIAYLIPCHRVIHKSGIMDGYRWNSERKKAILVWESGRVKN